MADIALCSFSAAELGKLIRERKVSPVEIVQANLERISKVKTILNSWITLVPEKALEEAQRAEKEIHHGEYRGPLHGIPCGIKDLFETKGIRTTYGCRVYDSYFPLENLTTITRLRKAGAILLGKNNMHTLALGPTGENLYFGSTHNPWDIQCYSGGSSGGPASAVASGECVFSLGSDSGGSIRMPAVKDVR